MARLLSRTLVLSALVAGLAVFAAACGDDDDDSDGSPSPATATSGGGATETTVTPTTRPGTPTPTPEANTAAGFRAALQQFNRELSTGTVDPLVARFKVVDYTCKASDINPGGAGGPECTTAGQVIRAVQTSSWRSEGGLRVVDRVVENLKRYQAGFDTAKSDTYGPGTFRVYAFDATKNVAVLTVTSKCLEGYRCPESGFQRLVFVANFEYLEGRWKIASLTYAFVLGEEFLDPPSAEAKLRMPAWEKFQ